VLVQAPAPPGAATSATITSKSMQSIQPNELEARLMQLEDYFDFLSPEDIRIKDHRIGIETVLYDYLFRARTPEEIQQSYPSLTLEKVHATILYYLHNKETVSQYIENWLAWGQQQRQLQTLNPHPAAEKLRRLKAQKESQYRVNAEISS
jgi:uncharacterized protein (DUF433 family)